MKKTSPSSKSSSAKSDFDQARDTLTRYVAQRDHSRLELKQKLARKFAPEIVSQTLEWAEQHRLLASADAISKRVHASLGRQLKSHRQIQAQLKKKGLPKAVEDREQEAEKIRALIEKRFKFIAKLSYEERVKAYRYLKYRGFSDSLIKQVLNEK